MKLKKKTKQYLPLICIIIIAIIILLIVLLSNNKQEETIVVEESLYDISKFDMSNTFYTYEDDDYTSMAGIDVSEHNGTIDWAKVKESGAKFAFIRIGWRGYTEGNIYLDNNFKENYENAKANNIKVGVYFFSQAITADEAKQEAEFANDNLKGLTLDLPVVYDFENITEGEARSDNLTKQECTNNALTFLKNISNKYDVMLYANSNLIENYYDISKLADYNLWYAQYHSEPTTKEEFVIWQYSEDGNIEGIEKPTDLNIMFIKKD